MRDQWLAISARIKGLTEAARLYADFLGIRSSDSYGIGRGLQSQCESIIESLKQFHSDYQTTLSREAIDSIRLFLPRIEPMVNATGGSGDEKVRTALVLLAAFDSEFAFLLEDQQSVIRLRSERAFIHLQRSIVADLDTRKKWGHAFDDGEVACEKLGAIHLLSHGIWAFKVDGAGAKTDLIYQDRLVRNMGLDFADGLVLTEWKRATAPNEARSRFEDARRQSKNYSEGVLAGIELATYRFAIVVSRQQVDIPDDFHENGRIYRHINIAVDPTVPSRQ